jgi:enterobactin synthetase component D
MEHLNIFKSIQNPDLPINTSGYHSVYFNYNDFDYHNYSSIKNYHIIKNFNQFVPKRKIEFLAGRYCAHKAIEMISFSFDDIINIKDDRSPKWPEGLVGSITHTKNFASAAVAHSSKLTSIGIDSEVVMQLPQAIKLHDSILTDNELHKFKDCFTLDILSTVFFSAKESVFKCLYPLTYSLFGFQDVEIFYFCPLEGIFKFKLLANIDDLFTKNYEGSGNVTIDKTHVHTAVQLI